MGIFFGKCIQDGHHVDMPLSRPFLKLLCHGDVEDNIITTSYRKSPTKQHSPVSASTAAKLTPWYSGLLTHDDLTLMDPVRADFLQQLSDLSTRKMALLENEELSVEERTIRLQELTLDNSGAKVEDLW